MASTSSVFAIVACFALVYTSNANAFLKKDVSLRNQRKILSQETIEQRFLEEVRGTTGKGAVDLQIPAIKAALEPMWASLPKNQYGGLDNAQVRYALHRLFVQRHGWHIDGLTDISDQSSPAGVMKERVPAFLMELFEEAFGQTGLKLNELAVFAGTLERLIHDENIDRLKNIYTALDIQTDANMSMDEADKAMKAFMLSLILNRDIKDASSVEKGFAFLDRQYPAWAETQRWLRDVRQAATGQVVEDGSSFNLALMENATEQISMQLGGFLDTECRRMKNALLEVEEQSSGRVLLSNFYKKGLEKGLHFVETPAYLRQLGALDESQPGEPRVILPNFITSQNNCLVDTGSYSVCCLNECEDVMARLERSLGVPEATPDEIVSAISAITTSTVSSPQTLSQAMRVRLELVAERNSGKVPLYGRLFAQWLHFAFPRECPYPHVSGSTNPLTPEDYYKATAEKSNMKMSDLHEYINSVATASEMPESEQVQDDLLTSWSDDEEVFFMPTESSRTFTGTVFKSLFVVGGCAGVVFAAADAAKRFGGMDSVLGKAEKAHLV